MKKTCLFLAVMLAIAACTPFEEDDIDLPAQPPPPNFSMEFLTGDSNRIIVKNLSAEYFDQTFDFPGGIPAKSKRIVDTVFYAKAGDYLVTLYIAGEGGGGVSKKTQVTKITKDATALCDPMISLLTGSCEAAGKCWTFTHAAEAVRLGPVPGSKEWYKSPVNGLQDAQYDDQFCFYFENSKFQYFNNGLTVDPWNGYTPIPFAAPTNLTWLITKGTGDGGSDQIVLPAGTFIGTWDSGPVYDIATLTETQLVLRSPIRNQNGTPGTGWFEFTLQKI